MALSFTFVKVRGEKCELCGCLINLDYVRLDCPEGQCPYRFKAGDRVAEAAWGFIKSRPDYKGKEE